MKDLLLERQSSLVSQQQDAGRSDALGHRGDAKNGVREGGCIGPELAHAGAAGMGQLRVHHDPKGGAGNLALDPEAGEERVDCGERSG
jgi:hypothetical protein